MINKLKYNQCTICQACINICPSKCISLKDKNYDFFYPRIELDKCINCNLCEKVCPVINPIKIKDLNIKSYAALNLDNSIRKESSSGGIFTALASEIIINNGIVSGVSFDKDFNVNHIIVDKLNDLRLLRGSKYVQSNIGSIFLKIKSELDNNKKVLFSGCPCQIAGLKGFLRKKYDNLYTVDFICHGIPSNVTFKEYCNILKRKNKSEIVSFKFRDKSNGWHSSMVRVEFANKKIYSKCITEDKYMRGFLGNIYLKPSCHECKFRNFKSGSDITLADFWGAEVVQKDIDDNKGLSAVIINTENGEKLLAQIREGIYLKEVDIKEVIKYNKSLIESSAQSNDRELFFKLAYEYGYKRAFNKVCKEKYIARFVRVLRNNLGKIKRGIMKKG